MKNFFSAFLFYVFLIPVSLLPFPVLYVLSDVLYVFLFYVYGYRRKIVMNNLLNSFPGKSDKEIFELCKKFYHHFSDIILESVKVFTISEKEILRRVEIVNRPLVESFFEKNQNVVLITGHYANWEWASVTVAHHSSHNALGIYQKLANKFFDEKMKQSRSRFGLKLMTAKQTGHVLEQYKGKPFSMGFIADQSPHNLNKVHWMRFLNQDTAVFTGAERIAKQYNCAVLYGKITRKKRSFYKIEYELITDSPNSTAENEITEKAMRINEKLILEKPGHWLWTHRRWKRKKSLK